MNHEVLALLIYQHNLFPKTLSFLFHMLYCKVPQFAEHDRLSLIALASFFNIEISNTKTFTTDFDFLKMSIVLSDSVTIWSLIKTIQYGYWTEWLCKRYNTNFHIYAPFKDGNWVSSEMLSKKKYGLYFTTKIEKWKINCFINVDCLPQSILKNNWT